MLRGADILCFSSIDWDFNWQGHQEVMDAFARAGNRVLFVENTGIRAPRLRDLPRVKQRLRRWWKSANGFRQERENLFVFSPLVLPFPYSRVARWVNAAVMSRALRRWARATGFYRPIVWTFLPTRLAVDVIDAVDPELVVYYCIADFEQLSTRSVRIAESERALLKRTDVVFVQGEHLKERCQPHADIHIFPFGVNIDAFTAETTTAPELRDLPRPIIGYVGGMHRHVDFEILEQVAAATEGTVVLVGPAQEDVQRLVRHPNVRHVGAQPHARIPSFVRGFDVGIIPYARNPYTETVYPTKLNEYLAMGIPVVSTDLPEVHRFNVRHGGVVTVTKDADDFATAVRRVIDTDAPSERARRVAVARENSWTTRIAEMSDLVEAARARRRRAAGRWDENLRRLYRRARRRLVGAVAGALTGYLVLFHTPLLWALAEPLRLSEPARAADAIVVFAGGVGESGKAGAGYQERVKRAIDLYREGRAPQLIFSSGYVGAFPEAEIMRGLAITHGVPATAVMLETQATNTYENVTHVRALLQRHGWRNILLVTSPYHTRRALLTWRSVAPEVGVVATPVTHSEFYAHTWGASAEQIEGIAREYAAIAAYWWRGWIGGGRS